MDSARRMAIFDAETADDYVISRAIPAAQRVTEGTPRIDGALHYRKVQALYQLQGDERRALSRALQRVDRRHYTKYGISRVEYRRETNETIEMFLRGAA